VGGGGGGPPPPPRVVGVLLLLCALRLLLNENLGCVCVRGGLWVGGWVLCVRGCGQWSLLNENLCGVRAYVHVHVCVCVYVCVCVCVHVCTYIHTLF